MNCIHKELLVILNDCIIDCLLIESGNTIDAKVGDKVVSIMRVGKVVEKSRIVIPSFN